MSLDTNLSIFTNALKAEFATAYEGVADPAPWKDFTSVIDSVAKIEFYPWMSPTRGITEFKGHRQYGKVESIIYAVRNLPYSSEFQVPLDDLEDERFNVKGFLQKPREMAERAKLYPGRAVLKNLGLGASVNAFDGVPFFANRVDTVGGAIGTGNNSLTYTTADAGTGSPTHTNVYKLAGLYTRRALKPCLWQERLAPRLMTNSGTPQSYESKSCRWWVDLRGAPAFGYWYDAVYVAITGLPNITEMHQIFSNMFSAMRTYKFPQAIATDDGEYCHEQSQFSAENFWMVGALAMENLLAQALNQDWVPQAGVLAPAAGTTGATAVATTNMFKSKARYIVSALFSGGL